MGILAGLRVSDPDAVAKCLGGVLKKKPQNQSLPGRDLQDLCPLIKEDSEQDSYKERVE